MKPHTPARPEEQTQRGAVVPDGRPPLPHERDQQTSATNPTPDPQIRRAASDLKKGQVDTDLRATPGLDADRRGDLVDGGEHGAGDHKPRAGKH